MSNDLYMGAHLLSPAAGDPAELAKKALKPKLGLGVITRFPRAMAEIAKVSAFGMEKYKADPVADKMNYLQPPNSYASFTDALLRHVVAEETDGVFNDADGGLRHAAQAAWNALARLELQLSALNPKG